AVDARNRALQLTLFRSTDSAGHQCLSRRASQAPKGHDGNPQAEDPALRRNTINKKPCPAAEPARKQRSPVAEASRGGTDEPTLHNHRRDTHTGEQQPDSSRSPTVTIAQVQHRRAWQHRMGEIAQERDSCETEQLMM